MTPDDIRNALETAEGLPREALHAGMKVAADFAPSVITVVKKAAAGDPLSLADKQFLFYGLHVLAAARDRSAYPSFMYLLRRSEQELEALLGQEYITIATRLLLGLFDGDASLLVAAIENREMDGGARWAVFNALARLTWERQVPAALTHDVIDRFEDEGWAGDGDPAWEGWRQAVMYLGLVDRAPKVRAAWSAGRFPFETEADCWEWEEMLTQAAKDPRNENRFVGDHIVPIEDPVAALSDEEGLGYAPPETTVSPDGRTVSMKIDQPLRLVRDQAHAAPTRSVKIGRNEPCPCGSGKKYKRCCGGVGQALH